MKKLFHKVQEGESMRDSYIFFKFYRGLISINFSVMLGFSIGKHLLKFRIVKFEGSRPYLRAQYHRF